MSQSEELERRGVGTGAHAGGGERMNCNCCWYLVDRRNPHNACWGYFYRCQKCGAGKHIYVDPADDADCSWEVTA